jgi:hypothetical protein
MLFHSRPADINTNTGIMPKHPNALLNCAYDLKATNGSTKEETVKH